jgi:hypothetical protein
LPDIFGINGTWVAHWLPSSLQQWGGFIAKGVFGAIMVGGYYLLGGFIVHALFRRYNPKDYQRMSLLQYSIMMFFLLTMVGLPIKMLLRLLWHIKYVWITPWFNV